MNGLQIESIKIMVKSMEKYEKSAGYHFLKRTIDIIFSFVGIIAFFPIMFVVAVAIKLDSKGPIIFSQARVGKNGKIFKMYKLRSMTHDAEQLLDNLQHKNEMTGPIFKIKQDPRITRVGRFIRKTSIDELPQLFNVIKGEMSLVGPRPNLPKEVAKFTSQQKIKLLAKPGLTCYWQVMGRSSIDFDEWMKLDLKYIKDRSTLLDIKLIFKTLGVFFGDKNAS
ncbi:putative undecaprenyl-phosphate N-acetylgalactosaminyl 1-phosphate transferase [Clostridium coskatii]|uniref:Undecaprenyl-phosphate N-acetylgalactosaminyl 1-phosphate transferase n=3 Tax=Clostridiaceae TaxID=31979 RepID=A0A162JAU1_9CLOT|nr:Exopolysaccharide biosynthesis polyprenyl glycosylphosphotransferase [Clostridium autoethanogenum DSM 10061]OAA92745.1 putative undecaprenyl-phosphate N-acetylgalactosaminyl 1-phosphate transferase [Clostridium coskatii]OBR97722.1 putative undecaprenyl-phosphate N-acetylgalactosaminyl 1-phosphate transferase [Clostridium coskatii]OVY48676.1 putative undecaprenyl-phosphate N-acetylgalactosaminyl 1-phosphate transferase [Clostridium autoethanogenum]DAD54221.1 TPA_exp: Galactosyl transferase Cp